MTTKGRKDVCDWLRKLARDIQREPKSFAKTFRARYLYANAPVSLGAERRSSPVDCSAFVLKACPHCIQMTNHIGDVCQKCRKTNAESEVSE